MDRVVIAGSTGFIGRAVVRALLDHGIQVTVIMRPGTEHRTPPGTTPLVADPLDHSTFVDAIRGFDAFIQLIGTPSPNPAKVEEFRRIDGGAGKEGALACTAAGIGQYIYLSVPLDLPIMTSYVAVRAEVEALIRELGLHATIIRPFYVLGPGRRWPYLVMPLLWLSRIVPGLAQRTRSMIFNTRDQVVHAIVHAVLHPPTGVDVIDGRKLKTLR